MRLYPSVTRRFTQALNMSPYGLCVIIYAKMQSWSSVSAVNVMSLEPVSSVWLGLV